jgi:hypothetical protein
MSKQRCYGYKRRGLVETAMYRYEISVRRRRHTRTLLSQRTDATIGCNVMNRMTWVGMAASVWLP